MLGADDLFSRTDQTPTKPAHSGVYIHARKQLGICGMMRFEALTLTCSAPPESVTIQHVRSQEQNIGSAR